MLHEVTIICCYWRKKSEQSDCFRIEILYLSEVIKYKERLCIDSYKSRDLDWEYLPFKQQNLSGFKQNGNIDKSRVK